MYSLYLDTATQYLCIGVAKDYKLIYKVQIEALKRQSELAIPELDKCLNELKLSLRDINEIVITIGPGSFTGIRIALCIAKVISSVQNIPLKIVPTLKAYAGKGKKIVLIDAKAARAYFGMYDDYQNIKDEDVLTLDEINKIIKDNPNYEVVNDAYLVEKTSVEIDILENLNFLAPNLERVDNVDNLVPLYFKDR